MYISNILSVNVFAQCEPNERDFILLTVTKLIETNVPNREGQKFIIIPIIN